MLPLSEKEKLLSFVTKGKKKKSYVEVAKIYGKTQSSLREIVKKEKEICASFAVTLQAAKVRATVYDKCLR